MLLSPVKPTGIYCEVARVTVNIIIVKFGGILALKQKSAKFGDYESALAVLPPTTDINRAVLSTNGRNLPQDLFFPIENFEIQIYFKCPSPLVLSGMDSEMLQFPNLSLVSDLVCIGKDAVI